ncbi:transmembrane anchor protein [Ferrovibrio sp.]|uniref:transmembrane anchor protein n=1 Tax=Ferrovibrio sp. TaxID=1917215 RepID=UPI0035148386
MYNTDMPTRAELPSSKQLIRSTAIAIAAAAAILVSIVLPAEYNIDPTGIGRALGLAEMGEIKVQLAKESEEDAIRDQQGTPAPAPERRSMSGSGLGSFFISSAMAQPAGQNRVDERSFTLQPGEGVEVKLEMKRGDRSTYEWVATDEVNYDMHADGSGKSTSYKKGRGVTKDEGMITAAFDGNHGWFWRNRTKAPVTVKIKVTGPHTSMKRM